MKSFFTILVLLIVVLSSGCAGEPARDVSIPAECAQLENDICGLYQCSIGNCWCDDTIPDPIVYSSDSVFLYSEEDARQYVMGVLDTDVGMVSQANDLFFYVFAGPYSSEAYTVAYDGTIFRTSCGV